jgi:hypothetical protein
MLLAKPLGSRIAWLGGGSGVGWRGRRMGTHESQTPSWMRRLGPGGTRPRGSRHRQYSSRNQLAEPIIIGQSGGAPPVRIGFRTFPKWNFGVRYHSWCARRISGCGGRIARSLGKTGLSFCPVCPWVGAYPTRTGIGVDEQSNARQDVAPWARCPGQGCPE